eukprot:scaffold9770_cov110-Isochrysis_galbana.AAC.4
MTHKVQGAHKTTEERVLTKTESNWDSKGRKGKGKKKLVRLKKPRLPSALGLSGACGEEAY